MDDLTTIDGTLKFCADKRAEMESAFARDGRFESAHGYSFMAWVFATHDLDETKLHPGKKLDRPEALACDLPRLFQALVHPRRLTDLFGKSVREFAALTRATGVLLLTEMWHATTPEGGKRSDLPPSLADAPGRSERLVMFLEHSEIGCRQWFAEIRRDPTRLDPWQETRNLAVGGRLVNLTDLTRWKN